MHVLRWFRSWGAPTHLFLFQINWFWSSGDDSTIIESVVYTLSGVSQGYNGAQAVVNAGIMDFIPGLLNSPSLSIRNHTARIVAWLTRYGTREVEEFRIHRWHENVS
jgi:hypothetical protein